MDIHKIIRLITTEETVGIPKEDLAAFEQEANWKLPAGYSELIEATDGGYGEVGGFYIEFWNLNDVAFYVDDIETLDGLIPFASDGCGMAFAFDRDEEGVFSVPMDCLLKNYSKRIAKDFDDFLDKIEKNELIY